MSMNMNSITASAYNEPDLMLPSPSRDSTFKNENVRNSTSPTPEIGAKHID